MKTKKQIEDWCSRAGLSQEQKFTDRGVDVLLADGFVEKDKVPSMSHFGVNEKDFPHGLWLTVGWIMKSEEDFSFGTAQYKCRLHDFGMDNDAKKRLRLREMKQEVSHIIDTAEGLVHAGA